MEFAPKLNRLIGNNILYVADYDKYLFIDILLIQILFYFFIIRVLYHLFISMVVSNTVSINQSTK